ncbi:MAG TPA: patatin-like phospholipase family protein [Thermomicrobiales bacterium]|nr:patatin-like phospholipase family protein [Thermomicrobiales bacterium]
MSEKNRREAMEDSSSILRAGNRDEREGIALCLSGGGFRAALYHLGALRRLNELGILGDVATISAVSGGSILAAHLVERIPEWPAKGDVVDDWDGQVAQPFRDITSQNLRTGPVLRRFLPWNWTRPEAGIRALARRYQRQITSARLGDLPDRPRYIFCATDMVYGRFWVFEKRGAGRFDTELAPYPKWPVARAVAASSCFPPIFAPMAVAMSPGPDGRQAGTARPPKRKVDRGHLTDGGTYDNTGVEAVWEDHATILVSDGGGTFDTRWRNSWLWRLRRYPAIANARVRVVQKRWLFASFRAGLFDGTIWGIDEPKWDLQEIGSPTVYPRDLVETVIAQIRTDLDAFSEAEQKVLENHGYLTAEAAIRALTPSLPKREAPALPPYPEWMDPDKVREALADSDQRRMLGRPYASHPLDLLFE